MLLVSSVVEICGLPFSSTLRFLEGFKCRNGSSVLMETLRCLLFLRVVEYPADAVAAAVYQDSEVHQAVFRNSVDSIIDQTRPDHTLLGDTIVLLSHHMEKETNRTKNAQKYTTCLKTRPKSRAYSHPCFTFQQHGPDFQTYTTRALTRLSLARVLTRVVVSRGIKD